MEIWKEIKGFEDYEVSNLGRVKSLDRIVIYSNGRDRDYKGKVLKLKINTAGYPTVNLYKNAKSKTKMIHQLVAVAFLNHTPCGYKLVVDHKNGNKLDNALDNLHVITTRKNTSKGFKNCSSKHTGVTWHKSNKKWMSYITVNKKTKHLGYFTDESEAAKAYQNALAKLVK